MPTRYDQVFVYYPRGVRTGGPEALHQLVAQLTSFDIEAFLVPVPASAENARVPEYDHYGAREVPTAPDEPRSLVVLPETDLRMAQNFRRAQVACWWLSVDNSGQFDAATALSTVSGSGLRESLRFSKWFSLEMRERLKFRRLRSVEHFAQSEYAWTMLRSRGIPASLLSDYTSTFDAVADRGIAPSRPVLAYNGRKGADLARALVAKLGESVDAREIANMTSDEVVDTLRGAQVYLDLGAHPGKDRMPREAAALGCLVLVARRGSAAFSLDVPIPEHHKIDVTPYDPEHAAQQTLRILDSLPEELAAQNLYRLSISNERQRFAAEVARTFVSDIKGSGTSVVDLLSNDAKRRRHE